MTPSKRRMWTILVEMCVPWTDNDPPRQYCDPRGGSIKKRDDLTCPKCGGMVTQRLGIQTDRDVRP